MTKKYSDGFVSKQRTKWRAFLSYQDSDGTQQRLSKSTGIRCYPEDNRNKSKAEEFLREWRKQLILEDQINHPEGGDVAFYDYCDYYLSMHPVKATTMSGYRTTMKKLLGTELGNTALCEVSADHIRRWEQDMRDGGLKETTIAHQHAFISMVLKYAFAEGKIARNPIHAVKGPRRKPKPVNSLTREQRAIVLRRMDECENYPLATAVRIALLTGMRRSEICALRWCDVDLDERVIHVIHSLTKENGFKLDTPKDPAGGNTMRTIPIGRILTGYLRTHRQRQRAHLAELGGGWVDTLFVVGDPVSGEFLNPEMLSRQWSMLSQAEVWKGTQGERVRFHDLRHTFATLVIRDGIMDVMSLSKILGHRDASMTLNVYSDALAEAKRSGMDALDSTLGIAEHEEREEPKPRGRHMRKS